MVYVSVDIETTGLDSEKNSVLSIGAIIEDTSKKLPFDEIPKFNAIISQHDIFGSPRAILMNKDIIEMISIYIEGSEEDKEYLIKNSGYSFYSKEQVIIEFYLFLQKHINNIDSGDAMNEKQITINVAGKNFSGFDKLFLQKLPRWKQLIKTRQRVIDPAPLYCNWLVDETLPSLSLCKERAEIKGIVTHDAIEDAWDVIELLRKFY